MKWLSLFIIIFFGANAAYSYEQIYYPEEEYSPRYIIKDYSYIENYNQLWQELSSNIDITYYDEFIHKTTNLITSRAERDEAINFIKNYRIKLACKDGCRNNMAYPAVNSLIMQNKALLKARRMLDNVPGHDKTSLVYLAAGLSYIYSDGLYELEKLRKIFKEWIRLGADDFPEIKGEEREKRYKLFSYIANMPENPSIADEFINILNNEYYNNLIFNQGLFDVFNADFFTVVNSVKLYAGSEITEYFVEHIRPEYMDILTNNHFRLDAAASTNPYFTVWENIEDTKRPVNTFYVIPFNKQTFTLNVQESDNSTIFKINYYNPAYIDTPEYAVIKKNKSDNSFHGEIVWHHTLMRNKVVASLISSPSFECKGNLSSQQAVICESFILRMYDKISSRKYYLVYKDVKDSSKKSRLLSKEKEMFKERLDDCYIDRRCIKEQYESYIDRLINFN